MTIPAIKNYETRPPAMGWGLTYTLNGQEFPLTGNWRDITKKIANIQLRNRVYRGMDAIFEYCNAIWCSRDPDRCMTPAQRSTAMKTTGSVCTRCGHRRTR